MVLVLHLRKREWRQNMTLTWQVVVAGSLAISMRLIAASAHRRVVEAVDHTGINLRGKWKA
jgi:hypothetical protein